MRNGAGGQLIRSLAPEDHVRLNGLCPVLLKGWKEAVFIEAGQVDRLDVCYATDIQPVLLSRNHYSAVADCSEKPSDKVAGSQGSWTMLAPL